MQPKLFSSMGSQHARRVRMLVHELGMEIEIEEVPFGPEGFGADRPAFLALNPNGKVPVLEHDGMVLWESNTIMNYLVDLHGETPLLPSAARERAQVSMWQIWQAAHLTPAADGLFFENRVKPGFLGQPTDPARVAELEQSFHRWMTVIEHALASAEYLALGRLTCADISCACALMQAEASKMPLQSHPTVEAWLARIHARPSWIATEPGPMPG